VIKLKEGFKPQNMKIYPLSSMKQVELYKFLEENLRKGYIHFVKGTTRNLSPT
jgi:histone acetyltransferase (RNA polymerase elongator complex component)